MDQIDGFHDLNNQFKGDRVGHTGPKGVETGLLNDLDLGIDRKEPSLADSGQPPTKGYGCSRSLLIITCPYSIATHHRSEVSGGYFTNAAVN